MMRRQKNWFSGAFGYKISRNVKLCYSPAPMRGASAMNVSLTPQLEDLVKKKVASGLYGSASEVMREALRLLDERDRLHAMRLEELRGEIQKGLESGEPTPLDMAAIKARGRKRLATAQKKATP
jgi:antitoxin ParD1/3/4